MANLITPVQRSRSGGAAGGNNAAAGGASVGGIPYRGRRVSSLVTQAGRTQGDLSGGIIGGDNVIINRTLGTSIYWVMGVDADSFTANIGASNAEKVLALDVQIGSDVRASYSIPIPMLGLTSAGTQVGRWGGFLGPLHFFDTIDREGSIDYELSFTFGSIVAATWEIHWQEIRDS